MNIDKSVLNDAITKWGTDDQIFMLQEESMELAMAIHKFYRRDFSAEGMRKIEDEFADVLIMSEQAKLILNMDNVQKRIDFKIDRLKKRLLE